MGTGLGAVPSNPGVTRRLQGQSGATRAWNLLPMGFTASTRDKGVGYKERLVEVPLGFFEWNKGCMWPSWSGTRVMREKRCNGAIWF